MTSLERDRDQLEDDLDDKEAEIDDFIKKIEELEKENKEKDNAILKYKAKLDSVNEEIKSLRTKMSDKDDEKAKRGGDVLIAEYEKRVKDYELMLEKMTKEVSSLQGRLSTANQRNKDLEEKVKASKQVRKLFFSSRDWLDRPLNSYTSMKRSHVLSSCWLEHDLFVCCCFKFLQIASGALKNVREGTLRRL